MTRVAGYWVAYYIETMGADGSYFHFGDVCSGVFPGNVRWGSFRFQVNRNVSVRPVLYEGIAGWSWRAVVAVRDYFVVSDSPHNNLTVFKASFLS